MDTTAKLLAGQAFSPEVFKCMGGSEYRFGVLGLWQMLFVFRGQHCPICKTYLKKLEGLRASFEKLGVTIAAVSADTEAQTRLTIAASAPGFRMLYGMDIPAMQRLGLYISEPRSSQETDHRFPEPALLVVNPEGILQIVDVANAPFVRPDLDTLLMGMGFVIEKNYPIRGTYR